MTTSGRSARRSAAPAERTKAFVDAVVAIAMTLLILPLMESIGEAATERLDTLQWLATEADQLFSFALSFVLIANFWTSHHRLFRDVERIDGRLMTLTMLWLLAIVWMPVATALVGQMPVDTAQKVVYIGTLAVASLLLVLMRWYLLRHPDLHAMPAADVRAGMRGSGIVTALFVLAGIVAVTLPAVGYWAMLLLLAAPVCDRIWEARRSAPEEESR